MVAEKLNSKFSYYVGKFSKAKVTENFVFAWQFSLQDNGSAKYFQSGIHTPKMGEKVAQVSHVWLSLFYHLFNHVLLIFMR